MGRRVVVVRIVGMRDRYVRLECSCHSFFHPFFFFFSLLFASFFYFFHICIPISSFLFCSLFFRIIGQCEIPFPPSALRRGVNYLKPSSPPQKHSYNAQKYKNKMKEMENHHKFEISNFQKILKGISRNFIK